MGGAQSTPERVLAGARSGDAAVVRAVLATAPPGSAEAQRLVGAEDKDGLTALMHACNQGRADLVQMLLAHGADVGRVSALPDATTALHLASGAPAVPGREVVVDMLLRAGANAFVENGRGQTSVDVAARAGTAALARRLEVGALFSGHLMMKVPRLLGLGAEWKPRWVVASPRYPCPRAAGDGVVRRTLACYKVADVTSPVCKAWLDGSAARSAVGSRGHLQCELALHPSHAPPAGAHLTGGGGAGYILHFRPADGTATALDVLRRFMLAVNGASLSVAERRESDDELARRLQEQYDAEAARYLVQNPDAPSPVQQPRLPVAARARPAVVPLELPAAEPVAASAPRLPDDAFFGGVHSPAVTALRTSSAAPGDGSSWNDSTPSPSRASAAGRQASAPLSDGPSGSAPCPPARQQALQAVPVQDGRLPATDVASMRLPSPGSDGEDEESCVVCMAAPASAGFLHGDSMHKCCCTACARQVSSSVPALCPVCRSPVDRVVLHVYS